MNKLSNFYKFVFRPNTNNVYKIAFRLNTNKFDIVSKTNLLNRKSYSYAFGTSAFIYITSFYTSDTIKASDNKIPNMNFDDLGYYYMEKMRIIFNNMIINNESITEDETKKNLYKICPELLDDNIFDYIFPNLFNAAYTMWQAQI